MGFNWDVFLIIIGIGIIGAMLTLGVLGLIILSEKVDRMFGKFWSFFLILSVVLLGGAIAGGVISGL